jgi:hypothetical protein
MATRYGWMADTDEKAFRKLNELLRSKSAAEKLAQVLEMAAMPIRASQDLVRKRNPDFSEQQVFLEAAALRLGRDTVARVYGQRTSRAK